MIGCLELRPQTSNLSAPKIQKTQTQKPQTPPNPTPPKKQKKLSDQKTQFPQNLRPSNRRYQKMTYFLSVSGLGCGSYEFATNCRSEQVGIITSRFKERKILRSEVQNNPGNELGSHSRRVGADLGNGKMEDQLAQSGNVMGKQVAAYQIVNIPGRIHQELNGISFQKTKQS